MIAGIFGSGDSDEEKEKLEKKIREKEKEIEELKEKIDDLERNLEKERERAKEAITEKQEVDKKLKKSKQRIETLKDKLSKTEEKVEERKFREASVKNRRDILRLLKTLNSYKAEEDSLWTQYFTSPSSAKTKKMENITRKIESKTGYVGFWDETGIIRSVLVPPLPMKGSIYNDNRFHLEDLEELFKSGIKIGFASLHAGDSGIGILNGSKIETFNVVKTRVKEKHSKGGFSQGRFERNREEQIDKHAEKISDRLSGLTDDLDFFVLSGNKKIMRLIKEEIQFDAEIVEKNLDIGSINKNSGEEISKKIWSCKTYIP